MYLTVFVVFFCLGIILVALGLFKNEHTELSLIGFFLLFLLSFTLMGNNLEYKTGQVKNITVFDGNHTGEEVTYVYSVYDDSLGFLTSSRLGFYLAVAFAVGFIGVLMSLRRGSYG